MEARGTGMAVTVIYWGSEQENALVKAVRIYLEYNGKKPRTWNAPSSMLSPQKLDNSIHLCKPVRYKFPDAPYVRNVKGILLHKCAW